METLAERYVDIYERAIESYGAGPSPTRTDLVQGR